MGRRPDTVRGADVAFISYARLPKDSPQDGFLQSPPELVIEVFARDALWERMEQKIADYHRFGVDLVWVLDPHTLALRSYEKGKAPVLRRERDIADAAPHVPGFAVEVRQFFEE